MNKNCWICGRSLHLESFITMNKAENDIDRIDSENQFFSPYVSIMCCNCDAKLKTLKQEIPIEQLKGVLQLELMIDDLRCNKIMESAGYTYS